jgi:hypothetical protein
MKRLAVILAAIPVLSAAGCYHADCVTVRHIRGVLVESNGRPVSGWVGATEREEKPEYTYEAIAVREKWAGPDTSSLGLTHTGENGRFELVKSRITWGYTLLFGLIPLGSTTPPEVLVLDELFLHVHDEVGWRSVRIPLSPEQQTRSKPGERWVSLGRVALPKRQE